MFPFYVRSFVMKENNNNECVSSKYEIDESTFQVNSFFSSKEPMSVTEKIEKLIRNDVDTIATEN